jgi:hypothetical protein
MAKTAPSSTAGTVSTTRPQRKATVKPANPAAEAKAARVPKSVPPPICPTPPTMMTIPTTAKAMAPHVRGRTLSPKITWPKTAARKGEAEKSSTALATVVDCSAVIAPPKAKTRPSPPITPAQPMARTLSKARRGPIQSISTGSIPSERQKSTVQDPALSIQAIRTPCTDQSTPAARTRPAPVANCIASSLLRSLARRAWRKCPIATEAWR